MRRRTQRISEWTPSGRWCQTRRVVFGGQKIVTCSMKLAAGYRIISAQVHDGGKCTIIAKRTVLKKSPSEKSAMLNRENRE